MTKAIAKLIQTDQTHQIPTQLQTGRDLGMQMLDQALLAAIQAKEIDPDDAYCYATTSALFQKFVTDTSMLPKLEMTGTLKTAGGAGVAMAGHRRLSARCAAAARLGPALHRGRPAAHPPARRPAAAQERAARAELRQETLLEIMPKIADRPLRGKDGADFAYTLADRGRFRVNVMRQLNGMGAVFRAIPSKALTLDELKMPEAVRQMCRATTG